MEMDRLPTCYFTLSGGQETGNLFGVALGSGRVIFSANKVTKHTKIAVPASSKLAHHIWCALHTT